METKTKACIKCTEQQPLANFYKHSGMKDGHLNKCKACARKEAHAYAEQQDDTWRENERQRQQEKYHRLDYRTKRPAKDDVAKRAMRTYKLRYPEKAVTRNLSSNLRPHMPGCQLHHWSYSPEHAKDVIELPRQAHAALHRALRYDQATNKYRVRATNELLSTRAQHEAFINQLFSNHDPDQK